MAARKKPAVAPRALPPGAAPPSVDALLRRPAVVAMIEAHGRALTLETVRAQAGAARVGFAAGAVFDGNGFDDAVSARIDALMRPRLRRLFNLTGTVLHTNLGRALLAEEAMQAAIEAMRSPVNLEFDVASGKRGERDSLVEPLICRLTGAQAATVVNNNAAAVILVLNALAAGKQAVVSRGELIEIGGAFRLPDIMERAGCRLREIGTTNRTHARDYARAIGPETGLLMKVHTSNFVVQGFTKAVAAAEIATIAHKHKLPFVEDLGSGTLVDLEAWGLPHEPTAREALAQGADLVTFSGDKLLGGPQVGIVAGSRKLIAKLNANPLKRALRVDKTRLAALEATLRLYLDPSRLAQRLPTLRLMTRKMADMQAQAARIAQALQAVLGPDIAVAACACRSQIGSGALPLEVLESRGVRITLPRGTKAGSGGLAALAGAFRALERPVIGRIAEGALHFDMRCLEDEAGFVAQLSGLKNWQRP